MAQRAMNNKGFSLIELMIAIVIIMVSMLALLTSMLISTRTNSANELRTIAIRLTNQTAESLLALPFDDTDVSVGAHTRVSGSPTQDQKGFPKIQQSVRGYQQTYSIQWTVAPVTGSASALQAVITVSYSLNSAPTATLSNTAVIYKHTAI